MSKRLIDQEFERLVGLSQADRGHGRHVAKLCLEILAGLEHLHGLTRTSRDVVLAAALLHDISLHNGPAGHHSLGRRRILTQRLLPLSLRQRRMVAEAVALHSRRADIDAFLRGLGARPKAAWRQVAARVAAILRIADGLDHARRQDTHIAAIVDDGREAEILADGPSAADNAAFAQAKVGLWNRLALRPVRVRSLPHAVAAPLMRPGEPALRAARRLLQRQLEQLMSREYGLGYVADSEYVHEMRVATRRLRTIMRCFAPAVKGGFQRQMEQLGGLADTLGAARDADTFLLLLQTHARVAPQEHQDFLRRLVRHEQAVRRRCYHQALLVCRSAEYRQFTRGLYQAVRPGGRLTGDLAPAGKKAQEPLWRTARRVLRQHLARAMEFGRDVAALSPARQHELRIACKRTRYAAELFGEIYPPGLGKVIDRLVELQDLLGQAHDCDVHGLRVREFLVSQPAGGTDAGVAAARALQKHLRKDRRNRIQQAEELWRAFTAGKAARHVAELMRRPRMR